MHKICMVLALTVITFVAHTKNCSAIVTGVVTDTKGVPVELATVTFTDESNPNNIFSNSTDAQGKYTINLSGTTGIDAFTPSAFSLGQNFPNPFNPTTTIPFTLDSPGHVELAIYNIMGQRVSTVIDGFFSAGSHTVTWNGMDERRNHAGAGIYLYRLCAGQQVETKKMLLLDGGGVSERAKSFTNFGAQHVRKYSSNTTYTVTITRIGIIPYEKTGFTITDGQTMDFTVSFLAGTTIVEGLTLVTIPSGKFSMGSTGAAEDEQPIHGVTLAKFEMSVTEITQSQYKKVIGATPSYFTGDENLPVEQVSWWDAIKFCNALSVKAGFGTCYDESSGYCDFSKNGFRLPTEAEWEYACRAGSISAYYWGDSSDETTMKQYCWYEKNAYDGHWTTPHALRGGSQPVGLKLPNALGIYDMHGNVWEWCYDWKGEYPYFDEIDPTGDESGSYRVVRGGSWGDYDYDCRSSNRNKAGPNVKSSYIGFRVVHRP